MDSTQYVLSEDNSLNIKALGIIWNGNLYDRHDSLILKDTKSLLMFQNGIAV